MISPKFYDPRNINIDQLFMDRQYGEINNYVQRRLHASSAFIDRLELQANLKGHEGCVNCLEWNSDGSLLASGSDDFQVILWNPFRNEKISTMRTKHLGNMFSVKFLPRHNDSLIATGAADKYIYVFDVNRHDETILSCNCHYGRVKRLATSPDSPYVFWSAGEDGRILQLDIREHHHCRSEENRTRLINLTMYVDNNAEFKCLAINPRRTEQLAVGANDPYARIYDRRMLQLTASASNSNRFINGENSATARTNIPQDCVTYYCPGHINKTSRTIEHESRAITYLTFNAAGTELLVNIGSDHIYIYDLLSAEQPVFLSLPEYIRPPSNTDPSNGAARDVCADEATQEMSEDGLNHVVSPITLPGSYKRKLPEKIEALKKLGNEYLENEKYLRAIDIYSDAISQAPECSVLYLNRATAYMRRMWYGDDYAALRDCHRALELDPSYIKAHFRLARALLELNRAEEANIALNELITRFPNYSSNHGVMMLHKDIKDSQTRTRSSSNGSYIENSMNLLEYSDDEFEWRNKAKDYSKRFVGHCNTTTDIKEANFFGYDGNFIVAGSDDGNFFIWRRDTANIHAIYSADTAIVNCVQPHRNICLMATSGIDHEVKIWAPVANSDVERSHLVSYVDKTVEDNQQKMKADPFDLNTRNAFCWNG